MEIANQKKLHRLERYHLKAGVVPSEARALATIEIQYDTRLTNYNLFKKRCIEAYQKDAYPLHEAYEAFKFVLMENEAHGFSYYKINDEGQVITFKSFGYYDDYVWGSTFPKQVCLLEHLEKLQFWTNKFTSLPDCFVNLKSLKVLKIGDISDIIKNFKISDSVKTFLKSLNKEDCT